jgi:hypothetical protein
MQGDELSTQHKYNAKQIYADYNKNSDGGGGYLI